MDLLHCWGCSYSQEENTKKKKKKKKINTTGATNGAGTAYSFWST
jgi:hypothetical protein